MRGESLYESMARTRPKFLWLFRPICWLRGGHFAWMSPYCDTCGAWRPGYKPQ